MADTSSRRWETVCFCTCLIGATTVAAWSKVTTLMKSVGASLGKISRMVCFTRSRRPPAIEPDRSMQKTTPLSVRLIGVSDSGITGAVTSIIRPNWVLDPALALLCSDLMWIVIRPSSFSFERFSAYNPKLSATTDIYRGRGWVIRLGLLASRQSLG